MNATSPLDSLRPRSPLLPAATALAALSAGGNLSAAIVHFTATPGQTTIAYPSGNHLFVDLDGGVTAIGSGSPTPGTDITFTWGGGIPQNTLLRGSVSDYNFAKPLAIAGYEAKLPAGALIDSSANFNVFADMTRDGNGEWVAGGNGYFGFEIDVSNTPLYGWIHLDHVATGIVGGNDTLTLVDWAYDDSGAGITAGTVPEPAESAAVMAAAMLAGSAFMLRRRRQKLASRVA